MFDLDLNSFWLSSSEEILIEWRASEEQSEKYKPLQKLYVRLNSFEYAQLAFDKFIQLRIVSRLKINESSAMS